MQDIIKVIIKDPEDKAREKTMINATKEFQYEVGGLFKLVYLDAIDGIVMIVNKERNLKELGLNFPLGDGFVVGTAVFVGGTKCKKGVEFRGLTDEEIQTVYNVIEGDKHYKNLKILIEENQ